jgi:hypothetical protein
MVWARMRVAGTRGSIVAIARNLGGTTMTGIATEEGSMAVAGGMDEAGMTVIVTET